MKINKKIILKNTSKLLALTTISTAGMFPTNFTSRFYSSTAQAKWFEGPYDEFMARKEIKSLTEILKNILLDGENKAKKEEDRLVWTWFTTDDRAKRYKIRKQCGMKDPELLNNEEEPKKYSTENITKYITEHGTGNTKKGNSETDRMYEAVKNEFLKLSHGKILIPELSEGSILVAYLNYVSSFRGHTLDCLDGADLEFINSSEFTSLNIELSNIIATSSEVGSIMTLLQVLVAAYSTKRLTISAVAKCQQIAPYILPAIGLLALSLGSGLIGKAYNGTKIVLGGVKNATKEFLRRNIYNRFALDSDPLVLRKKMEDYLYSIVLCQDKALEKLINIMSGMAEMWKISDKTGEPCKTASTMVFIGDSGIGKTLTARALSELFFKRDMQPWQFITSASIAPSSVSNSDNSKKKDDKNKSADSSVMTPADRLFSADSELVRQLKLNNKVIIVLDEIDKMHALDPNDTILEKLRNARDTGTIRIKNGVDEETVDVSRTVFICISNEKRECWGLEPVKLTEVQAAARTEIKRDKSLVNRFDVIEFDYFTKKAYTVILKPLLESLQQSYKKLYNINIAIDENLVCSIAEAAEELNKGARGVNDYMAALYGALVGYRAELLKSGLENSKEHLYISAKYNRDSKSFDITQNDPDALIQNYYDSSLAG